MFLLLFFLKCGHNGCKTPPTQWTKSLRTNNAQSSSVDPSLQSAVKRPEPTEQSNDHKAKASKVARLSLSDPNAAEKISLAAAALRLQHKENVDPQCDIVSSTSGTGSSVSSNRRSVPQVICSFMSLLCLYDHCIL